MWHLSIFLSRLIPYCQYSICTKFHVKWTNIFWDTECFFTVAPPALPPVPAFSQVALRFSKSPVQVELKVHALPRYILTLFSHNRHDHARICILVNIFSIRSSSLKKIFCCLSHPSFWFSKAKWKIIHAENEKLENGQPSASLPLSHPHATIIRHLPHQRLYD